MLGKEPYRHKWLRRKRLSYAGGVFAGMVQNQVTVLGWNRPNGGLLPS